MKTYTFSAAVGKDESGNIIYKEFVIEAASFSEARYKLAELVKAE